MIPPSSVLHIKGALWLRKHNAQKNSKFLLGSGIELGKINKFNEVIKQWRATES